MRNAIDRLDRAVEAYADDPQAEFVRDALISRFTFTFSQTTTTLGRYLGLTFLLEDTNIMSPRQLMREAARLGVIEDCDAWLLHVANRNRVAHAYLESMAVMVAEGAGSFAADARTLLDDMEHGITDGD